jgi:hypothetical protein
VVVVAVLFESGDNILDMKTIVKVATAMFIALAISGYVQAQAPQNHGGHGSNPNGHAADKDAATKAHEEIAAKEAANQQRSASMIKLEELPTEKQAYLKAHPEAFTIDANGRVEAKTMNVGPAQEDESKHEGTGPSVGKAAMPAGYPSLEDTGNPLEDHKRYDMAKAAWIAANPAAYAAMNDATKAEAKTQEDNKASAPQAEQPIGIGKPAPIEAPKVAVVQTHEPRVLTEEDKANAAKSMEQHEKSMKGVKPEATETARPSQPNDAVDPGLGKPQQ